jgi:bifunctional DNA-binding transcriptional regulator/antitoxin component of YhaV-PrlF toxin-antitoxin module
MRVQQGKNKVKSLQYSIPSKLRLKYSIKKGTKVAFVEEENRFVLQPFTPEFIRSLRSSLGEDSTALEFLLKDRRRERKL